MYSFDSNFKLILNNEFYPPINKSIIKIEDKLDIEIEENLKLPNSFVIVN